MDALSAWAGAWSDVVGGGLAPLAGGIHEEAEIFGMVVPVSRQNVEGCASRQFTEFPAVTRDPQEGVGDDLVGKPWGLMMDVSQAGKCVQVESRTVHRAVEPSHSKESPFSFRCVDFQQTGFGHADAGSRCHEGVGMFHAPLLVGVLVRVRNGGKFNNPSGASIAWKQERCVRGVVQIKQGFGFCATSGCSRLQEGKEFRGR